METNYPAAIFDHFHENELNGIAVFGVTYRNSDNGPVPLTLGELYYGVAWGKLDRTSNWAKSIQQYLALLLNIASGKLTTFFVVSEDGQTASQAVQYIADLINDGDDSNDLLAKQIGARINSAQLLPADVIPEGYGTIYYAQPSVEVLPLSVSPNPGRQSAYTFSFGMRTQGRANLTIYNVAGQEVAHPLSETRSSGSQTVIWNGHLPSGRSLSRGVYFARLQTPHRTDTLKFIHLGR